MGKRKTMSRREVLRMIAVTGVTGFTGLYALQASANNVGAMMPGSVKRKKMSS